MGASGEGPAGPLATDELELIQRYWSAANYLSVGQIYLMDNPRCASHCARSMSSRGCSAIGARRRA